jgi:2'-5' RNA ligase
MRIFVAIEITEKGILDNITQLQKNIGIEAKAVPREQIHFTLQFIGDVDETLKEKIINVLNIIEFSKFQITIKGIGAFPRAKLPRVIWVGVDKAGKESLSNIAALVNKKLLELGFKNDKAFKPHLTIFRVKNKINDVTGELTKFNSKIFGTQQVSQIKLKKSTLTPNGPIYEDLTVVDAKG